MSERNLASLVLRHADTAPDRLALAIPSSWKNGQVEHYQKASYGELADQISALRRGLDRAGFQRGDRVVLMVPVSMELYTLTLAMLGAGIVVVLIDTGMGVRRVLRAIRKSRAQAIVSVGALLRYRFLLPSLWTLKKYAMDSKGHFLRPFAELIAEGTERMVAEELPPNAHGLITFTSGSTGHPKGADRTHGLLVAQHDALDEHFPNEPGEVDLPCFPVVTLHNLCCGITTVMPAVDLRAPGTVEPEVVIGQIEQWGVTRVVGAPAYVEKIARYLRDNERNIPSVRAVGVGGAPVSRQLCRTLLDAFPQADCQVIYGSTEAEPISRVPIKEIIESEGKGHLVGVPAKATELVLVSMPSPPPKLDERGIAPYLVAPGATGEVIVRGEHVNRSYIEDAAANRENKLYPPDGTVWHRTGDVGFMDEKDRLWLTGRTKDLIHCGERILYPLVVEGVIRELEEVGRAALVAHPKALHGELAVQLPEPSSDREATLAAVRATLLKMDLGDVAVTIVERIPVDQRHNSKIDRPTLRKELASK